MSRRRPLHTLGASSLAIIHNACKRARELNGPVGSITKRIATCSLMSSCLPFISTMLHQWLAILSFTDDYILTLEYTVEKKFPPSIHLFDGIDRLVCDAECLPGKLDDSFNSFPEILHKFPFLDWAVEHLISWLNFLISTLTLWGMKSTEQKDIMVDSSCNNPRTRRGIWTGRADSDPFQEMSPDDGKEDSCASEESLFPVSECLEDDMDPIDNEMKSVGMRSGTDKIKCSYKEMLEKGTKEDMETERYHPSNATLDSPRSTISEEKSEIDGEKDQKNCTPGRFNLNDPILELYEASWHLK